MTNTASSSRCTTLLLKLFDHYTHTYKEWLIPETHVIKPPPNQKLDTSNTHYMDYKTVFLTFTTYIGVAVTSVIYLVNCL